jgi:SPOR domain
MKFGSSELTDQVKEKEIAQPEKQTKRPGATTAAINGYGIQVASGPSAFTQAGTQYADLTEYGNLYSKQEDGRYKLRLGVYATRAEAEAVVAKINSTYPGAFTVPEPNFDPSLLIKSEIEETTPVAHSDGATKIASKKSAPKAETAPAPIEHSTPGKTSGAKPTPTKKESSAQPVLVTEEPSVEALTGYAVQVSTIPNALTEKDMTNLEPLSKHGNLYSREEDGLTKVRLGIYPTRLKAHEVMKAVSQDKKFKNAFVVEERGADESLVVGAEPLTTSQRPTEHSTNAKGPKSTPVNTNLPAIVYAVQLGSFAAERPIPMGEFAKLSEFGNLYSKQENGYNKVRLGVWADHTSAESAKNDAAVRGFPDATIVTEKGTDPALQTYFIAGTDPQTSGIEKSTAKEAAPVKPTEHSTKTAAKPQPTSTEAAKPFYIRVAALSNPEKFDGRQFRDLGPVERRPQANGTVLVLLGGYASADEANAVQDLLVDRGYADTYVVKEEKGKLNKVK